MPKISIIIPVYQAEKTIRKCLDSIINQSYTDYEIIVVNDGSEDKSEEIILEYKKNIPQIQYIPKKNSGVADTRNKGIQNATGDYIVFVDADDYVRENIFIDIVEYIEQGIELIKWKGILVDEEGEEISKIGGPIFEKTTGEEGFNQLYVKDKFIDALWVYAIKRTLFTENDFQFMTNTYHEDFGLLPLIIVKAKTMVSIDKYNYCYVQTR